MHRLAGAAAVAAAGSAVGALHLTYNSALAGTHLSLCILVLRYSTKMGRPPKRLFCPNCGWNNVRVSERAGFWDKVAKLLFLAPFRCRNCRLRFYRHLSYIKRALPMVTVHRPLAAPLTVSRPTVAAPPVIDVSVVPDVLTVPNVPAVPNVAASLRSVILLLDDDPALRKLLRRLLTREGYDVREAADAAAAAATLRYPGPHAAGIDLMIVNLSSREEGETAVRTLRRAHPELVVMALPRTSRVSAVVEGVRGLLSQQPVAPLV